MYTYICILCKTNIIHLYYVKLTELFSFTKPYIIYILIQHYTNYENQAIHKTQHANKQTINT